MTTRRRHDTAITIVYLLCFTPHRILLISTERSPRVWEITSPVEIGEHRTGTPRRPMVNRTITNINCHLGIIDEEQDAAGYDFELVRHQWLKVTNRLQSLLKWLPFPV